MKQISSQLYNKSQLAQNLADKYNLPLKTAETALNTVFDEMITALLKGQRVEIRNFGSFAVKKYKGYKGRNPKSKQSIRVKPKKIPFFKAGKVKEIINV